jgi:hypothetical protein
MDRIFPGSDRDVLTQLEGNHVNLVNPVEHSRTRGAVSPRVSSMLVFSNFRKGT